MHFRLLAVLFITSGWLFPYSVLTHEAIIDSAWDQGICPALLQRYPRASVQQLQGAHAYAYGGCIIQDMGYYPFGSKFFSDLVHYVRSGDFIEMMLRDARDLNEYAFALGSLAHYAADSIGHPVAVNPAVGLLYPKLRARFGPKVTYEDNPGAHLKVEFGFDVLQVARGNYASDAYHDFIGFQVSKPLLERAFTHTYGLELDDVFFSVDLALATYRRAVSKVIPQATKVAWQLKKDEIVAAQPGMTRTRFLYHLSRADYKKEWGHESRGPGWRATLLAWVLRVFPRIGPFRGISFKTPTRETERMFLESFHRALDRYRASLRDAAGGRLRLRNADFDTGRPTRAGEYRLADETYARLLEKLSAGEFAGISAEMRENILGFYGNLEAPVATKKNQHKWKKTLVALARLRAGGAADRAQ